MSLIKEAYIKGNQMIDDMRGFHPVITGVVVLAMVN